MAGARATRGKRWHTELGRKREIEGINNRTARSVGCRRYLVTAQKFGTTGRTSAVSGERANTMTGENDLSDGDGDNLFLFSCLPRTKPVRRSQVTAVWPFRGASKFPRRPTTRSRRAAVSLARSFRYLLFPFAGRKKSRQSRPLAKDRNNHRCSKINRKFTNAISVSGPSVFG